MDVRRNVAVEQQRGDVWEVVFNPKGKEGAYKNAGLSGGWAGFAKDQVWGGGIQGDSFLYESKGWLARVSTCIVLAHSFQAV